MCRHIKVVLRPGRRGVAEGEAAISVRLDMEAVDALQLDMDASTVKCVVTRV